MKLKPKFNLKREVKITGIILLVVGLIAFTERMKNDVAVGDIEVKIANLNENHFMDEQDVINLMQVNRENIKGASVSHLDLKAIEGRVKNDPFVRDAELYTDLKGNVVANVELRRPVARMVRNDGPDGYLAEDGAVMPVSDKFTARVILLSGPYIRKILKTQNLNETEEGKELMTLIDIIRNDDFWKAQIAQLDIDSKMRITMMPQVGDERIEFGKPENAAAKLKKLKVYYKEILPRLGWNKYSRVNLEYEGQIVAE